MTSENLDQEPDELLKSDIAASTLIDVAIRSLLDELLRPLLSELRQAGLPISPQEYALVMDVLHNPNSPFSLRSVSIAQENDHFVSLREQMRTVCLLLWSTTPAEQVVFDQIFDKHFALTTTSDQADLRNNKEKPVQSPNISELDDVAREQEDKQQDKSEEKQLKLDEPSWYGHISIVSPPLLDQKWKESMTSSPEFRLQFHVTERQLIRPWLLARRLRRYGPRTELDLAATIARYARVGRLVEPQFRPGLKNRLTLLTLVDYGGSMLPFRPLVNTLLNHLWALRGRFHQVLFYYFHDYPSPFLYRYPDEDWDSSEPPDLLDPMLTNAVSTADLTINLQFDGSVLIISDGGAANQTYEERRYQTFERLVRDLYAETPRLAWLNPLPANRWPGSTADRIKDLLPMYVIDADGLTNMALMLSSGTRS
ncbi:MAG: hypothetical protein IPM39_19450 [Chloroflexi bacterium]|nr:hypothetical protein [Chloroflexota bacterium]